jgi:hypothetical protein
MEACTADGMQRAGLALKSQKLRYQVFPEAIIGKYLRLVYYFSLYFIGENPP